VLSIEKSNHSGLNNFLLLLLL